MLSEEIVTPHTHHSDAKYDDKEEGRETDDYDRNKPLWDEVAAVIPDHAALSLLDHCGYKITFNMAKIINYLIFTKW